MAKTVAPASRNRAATASPIPLVRPVTSARDDSLQAIAFESIAHERISNKAILPSSSLKTNSRLIGLPGKFPVSRLVTMVLSSF